MGIREIKTGVAVARGAQPTATQRRFINFDVVRTLFERFAYEYHSLPFGVGVAIATFADDKGFCYPSHKTIAKLAGVSVPSVKRGIAALVRAGVLRTSRPDKRRSNRYQFVTGQGSRVISEANHEGQRVNYPMDRNCELPEGSPVNSGKNSKKTDQEKDEGAVSRTRPDDADRFAEFWAAYPNRVSKPRAIEAYRNALESGTDHETIMEGLKRWKDSSQWMRDDGEFIPNPSTWLNDERWADDPKPYVTIRSKPRINEPKRDARPEEY